MPAMAVVLRGVAFLANPNPRIHLPPPIHSPPLVCRVPTSARHFRARAVVSADGRRSRLVRTAAHNEDLKHSDIEVEKENEFVAKSRDSYGAWKKIVESFEEEAMMMKDILAEASALCSKKALILLVETSEKLKERSEEWKDILAEAYALCSKKASIVLEETSEKLKERSGEWKERCEELKSQSDTALEKLGKRAKDLREDGKDYFASSPESIKEVVEIYSSTDDLKDPSQVRDFYIGIPYGALLAGGGFLSFMFTGSTASIRFGLILGAMLFYLSYFSFKSWKRGQSTEVYLIGQTAIMTIIFLRECGLFFQRKSIPTFLMTLISGTLLTFYAYRMFHDLVSDSEKDFDN